MWLYRCLWRNVALCSKDGFTIWLLYLYCEVCDLRDKFISQSRYKIVVQYILFCLASYRKTSRLENKPDLFFEIFGFFGVLLLSFLRFPQKYRLIFEVWGLFARFYGIRTQKNNGELASWGLSLGTTSYVLTRITRNRSPHDSNPPL